MSRSPLEYLRHIQAEAEYLLRVTRGITIDQFLADETLQRAATRSLEIMEKPRNRFRSSFGTPIPELDWRAMAGMRDRLIHSYLCGRPGNVWDVLRNQIPDLFGRIRSVLAEQG